MHLPLVSFFSPAIDRALSGGQAKTAKAMLGRVEAIVGGTDDSAISQRTAIFAFSIRVLSAAIAYFSQVLMARWMGEFEYGIFVAVWVAFVILGGIACLGFHTGIIRFISEYRASGDDDELRGAIRGSLMWSLGAATLLAMTGALLLHFFSGFISSYFVMPVFLALVCLPMLALQEVQDGIARAYSWPGTALAPTFIVRPIILLATMAATTHYGFDANAQTAMLSAIAATWIASLAQFGLLLWRMRSVVPSGKARFLPMKWIAITMPIFLIEGFYNLLTNTDILFVGYFMPPDKVGIYFAAVKTLALVHFVYFAVKAAAAHRFATYKASGDHQRYEDFIRETIHWTFWPSLVLAIIMALTSKYFLMLFGPSFVTGQYLIWILAGGIVVRASVGAAESVLTMSGEQHACALVYAASLAVNVTLNILLIPRFGLEGAALATSMALVFEAGALYVAAKRRLGLHIFIIPSRRQIETGGVAG